MLKKPVRGATVAVQGYGNAGGILARLLHQDGARVVAVSDSKGGVYQSRGLDPAQLDEHKLRTGSVVGFKSAERITNEAGIRHEIETYNELIPGKDELSITLFIEIPERELRERVLVELAGLEAHIGVEVDGELFPARGKRQGAGSEAEGAYAGRTTAVHYLKARLSEGAASKLRARGVKAALVVSHPKYEARAELGREALEKLAEDLSE